jgi:hypothetical protein
MTEEHLTDRQLAAKAECEKAAEAYRIAWGGERTRAYARLRKATDEKVAADVEAARISRMEQGHFQGCPT